MTAALKPSPQNQPFPARRAVSSGRSNVAPFAPPPRTRRERQRLIQERGTKSTSVSSPVVRPLPSRPPLPSWLLWLVVVHRGSSAIALLLLTAALTIYGLTVHTQQLWGREYHQLRSLQQQERELSAATAALANESAQKAEDPSSNLVAPTPQDTIFLKPATPRPAAVVPPSTSAETPISTRPLGY